VLAYLQHQSIVIDVMAVSGAGIRACAEGRILGRGDRGELRKGNALQTDRGRIGGGRRTEILFRHISNTRFIGYARREDMAPGGFVIVVYPAVGRGGIRGIRDIIDSLVGWPIAGELGP
jgi:hypothetical protein